MSEQELIEILGEDTVYNFENVRRPYYRARGLRISEEEAFEIIRRADRYFGFLKGWAEDKDSEVAKALKETETTNNFQILMFNENHSPVPRGWCMPNGLIGCNGITWKYINIEELYEDCERLAKRFKNIDMFVACTFLDDYYWEDDRYYNDNPFLPLFKDRIKLDPEFADDHYSNLKFLDIENSEGYDEFDDYTENHQQELWENRDKNFPKYIEFGFLIKNGNVTIYNNKEEAREMYQQYDDVKGFPDEMYYDGFWDVPDKKVPDEYLIKCLDSWGLKGAEILKKYGRRL